MDHEMARTTTLSARRSGLRSLAYRAEDERKSRQPVALGLASQPPARKANGMKVVAILALLLAVGCAESPTPQSTIAEKPATATKMTIPQPVVTQALTRDMATSTIEAAFGSVTGATTVEAISQESPQSPEAVVLANIDGREMHLHFRRYDTGWR